MLRRVLPSLVLFVSTVSYVPAQTQTLRVYSELTRIGPDGTVVLPDRGREPRTILSPGVARGAWASFRLVVQPPSPGHIVLEIGQNPENAVKVSLYKEEFDEHGIPDVLKPVPVPFETTLKPDEKVLTFWLDLWVSRTAPVERIKVEPQLWFNNDWFTYPMEVRILGTVIQEIKVPSAALPSASERSDSSVVGPVKAAFCGVREKEAPVPALLTARQLLRRNVAQHLSLAKNPERLRRALFAAGAANLCTSGAPSSGPEWYLRFRDSLYGPEP